MNRDQRIRDFVHDLIVFRADDETDVIAWKLINTREFQRLRRIKQLGFSEFVFPGATHTRFSHCIGVYHTARLLLERIRNILDSKNPERERVCLLAALLHDIGHGPFSHAFEDAQTKLDIGEEHENWSARIIEGNTEIHQVLESAEDSDLAGNIANILTASDPADIYASIVSSQLDADRLDYLRRDRYMTGTGLGGFDFEWLLDCLDVEKIQQGEKRDFIEADTLCLNHKALRAAEGYLLARFHLYSQVYMHKTTRSAEKMLTALLQVVFERLREKDRQACPIPPKHPLVNFLKNDGKDLKAYLQLDDFSIWEALKWLSTSNHEYISETSTRLLERRLYKCFEASAIAGPNPGDRLVRLQAKLVHFTGSSGKLEQNKTILRDNKKISAYGVYEIEDPESLQIIQIRGSKGAGPIDIFKLSSIVEGMKEESFERYYVPDDQALKELKILWEEVSK